MARTHNFSRDVGPIVNEAANVIDFPASGSVPALPPLPGGEAALNYAFSPASRRAQGGLRRPRLREVLADALCVTVFGLAIFALRFTDPTAAKTVIEENLLKGYLGFLLLYTGLVTLFCHQQDLYTTPNSSVLDDALAAAKAVSYATLLLTSFIYISGYGLVSRLVVGSTALCSIAGLAGWRHARRVIVGKRLARGLGARNLLIVGMGKVGRAMAAYLARNPQLGYVVKGFLDRNGANDPRVLGDMKDLPRVARAEFIDDVFITIPSERELVKTLVLQARQLKVNVQVMSELYDGIGWNTAIHYVGWFPLRVLQQQPIPAAALLCKRIVDVVVSTAALVALSPLLALIALAVRLDSRGPILYRSQRVGKKGRIFTCYKFRTMVQNAEMLQESLRHLNERKAVLFKIPNDPRVTRIGRFLRRYSLDELPQLWNVLKADMSLVGPRPPIPGEFKQYSLEHLRRLDVTPGLTGLWQVTARQDPSFESYVSLDIQYIENWSPLFDLKLLLRTLPVILKGTGR